MVKKTYKFFDKFHSFLFISKKNETISSFDKPIQFGIIILIVFFGIFCTWAAIAPIDSYVRGRGNIVYEDRGQIVQHLEGGVIEDIFVKEGSVVSEGQVLMSLKSPFAQSNNNTLIDQICVLQYTKVRLIAEKNGDEILNLNDFDVDEECTNKVKIAESQIRLFEVKKNDLQNKVSLLNHHIEELLRETESLDKQKNANKTQLELANEEFERSKKLYEKEIIQKSQLNSALQKLSELQGKEGFYEAAIAKTMQQIDEDKIKIDSAKNNFFYDVERELNELRSNLLSLQEKRITNNDIIERALVRSPKDGVVKNLQFHTVGGVINRGISIMEIIPIRSDIIIEAKISNKDIAALTLINKNILNYNELQKNPIKSKARISTYSSKILPFIEADVYQVSADAFIDSRSSSGYYVVYAKISKEILEKFDGQIYPGMTVDIYIPTQSTTMLSYLVKPIVLSFSNSFRET